MFLTWKLGRNKAKQTLSIIAGILLISTTFLCTFNLDLLSLTNYDNNNNNNHQRQSLSTQDAAIAVALPSRDSIDSIDSIDSKRITMRDITKWEKDVGILIISDFEYDDIILIASLLDHAIQTLGDPQLVLNNVEIIFFADITRKDKKMIWKKKLRMAKHYFPKVIYDKIFMRWMGGYIKEGILDWSRTPQFTAEDDAEFGDFNVDHNYNLQRSRIMTRMPEKIDTIVLCPGYEGMSLLNGDMKHFKKKVNRFIMSVGGFNVHPDMTSESDMYALFEMAQRSKFRVFVDSSRFAWSGPAVPGQVHEIGDKNEMAELLKQSGGYDVVMDYLKHFNAAIVYNGKCPEEIEAKNPGIDKLRQELIETDVFDEEFYIKLNQFAEMILHEAFQYKDNMLWKGSKELSINEIDLQDLHSYKNWDLKNFQNSGFSVGNLMADFRFKQILDLLSKRAQDGPAADPVIAYWHWFANEHKLVFGQMLAEYQGTQDDLKTAFKKNGAKFFSIRAMIPDDLYNKICDPETGPIKGCISHGNMVQVQLQNKPKDVSEIAPKWRRMYQHFMRFKLSMIDIPYM